MSQIGIIDGSYIIKRACICSWIILCKEARDSRILDILRALGLSHHNQEGYHDSGNEQKWAAPHDEFGFFLESLVFNGKAFLFVLTQDDLS